MSELLKMDKITKIYPGVVANYQVDFSLNEGEIHALIGENGAGKSTLMNILFGMQKPTEGKIFLRGKEVSMKSSHDALDLGIGMVHQHFMLVPSLTVAENIILGSEIKKHIFLDKNKAVEITKALSEKYNLPLNPKVKVQDISVSQKQKLEILKALYRGAKILILDEPTAVLTPQEIDELFLELKLLKKSGHTIIFISHKLHEIKSLCDRMTIMRDGLAVGTYNVDEVTEADISKLMVGRDIQLNIEKEKSRPKEPLLIVDHVSYVNHFGKVAVKDISLILRAGEILGIAGVEGNGQSELIEIITGIKKATSGIVTIKGTSIQSENIHAIRGLGLSHIPEDRMSTGIAPKMSVADNLIAEKYEGEEMCKANFILDNNKISRFAQKLIKEFSIKTDNEKMMIKSLSGGNIQKVVVGREFTSKADLLIINQPTRGIDVGAIEFIRNKIIEKRDEGKAILLSSADLNEVMSLSDALVIMNSGEIVGYFEDASQVTEEELGLYMLGVKRQDKEEIRRATHGMVKE